MSMSSSTKAGGRASGTPRATSSSTPSGGPRSNQARKMATCPTSPGTFKPVQQAFGDLGPIPFEIRKAEAEGRSREEFRSPYVGESGKGTGQQAVAPGAVGQIGVAKSAQNAPVRHTEIALEVGVREGRAGREQCGVRPISVAEIRAEKVPCGGHLESKYRVSARALAIRRERGT